MGKQHPQNKLHKLYRSGLALLSVLILFGIGVRILFPEVRMDPALFLTEYMKFLGTLVTVMVGWALVHIFWETQERVRKNSELRKSLIKTLDRFIRLNLETTELLDFNETGKTLEERDKYVEANINRQRDLVHTVNLIRDHYYAVLISDIDLETSLNRFINEIDQRFRVFNEKPYDHLRKIDTAMRQCLVEIGKICQQFQMELKEEGNS